MSTADSTYTQTLYTQTLGQQPLSGVVYSQGVKQSIPIIRLKSYGHNNRYDNYVLTERTKFRILSNSKYFKIEYRTITIWPSSWFWRNVSPEPFFWWKTSLDAASAIRKVKQEILDIAAEKKWKYIMGDS